MRLCADRYPPEDFEMPDGVDAVEICAESGLAAAPGCPNRRLEYFASSADNPGRCLRHFRPRTLRPAPDPRPARSRPAIVSPRSGERYMYDPGIETGFQNLALQAAGAAGLDEVVWLVNGRVVGRVRPSGSEVPTVYWPLQPGRAVVKMVGLREGRETVREQACIIIH
jgi:hypothetical protein